MWKFENANLLGEAFHFSMSLLDLLRYFIFIVFICFITKTKRMSLLYINLTSMTDSEINSIKITIQSCDQKTNYLFLVKRKVQEEALGKRSVSDVSIYLSIFQHSCCKTALQEEGPNIKSRYNNTCRNKEISPNLTCNYVSKN